MIFKYCPDCGNKCSKKSRKLYICNTCNKNWYDQPTPSVAAFILDKEYKILFVTKNYNPYKGGLSLPGGFIDNNETLEEGLKREVEEETGIEITNIQYLFSTPGNYPYKNYVYTDIVVFYLAYPKSGNNSIKAQSDEVSEIFWLDPKTIDISLIKDPKHKTAIKNILRDEDLRKLIIR